MPKILDEFNYNLHCPHCNIITEHNIQKVDEEDNGEFIAHYAKCDICENIREVEEREINK